ncbi:MAG: hypothetical protein ABIN89_27355 [Chitinophagaceae bacterium]
MTLKRGKCDDWVIDNYCILERLIMAVIHGGQVSGVRTWSQSWRNFWPYIPGSPCHSKTVRHKNGVFLVAAQIEIRKATE